MKSETIERLRTQYEESNEVLPHIEELLEQYDKIDKALPCIKESLKRYPKRTYESIQWVIDALGGEVMPLSYRDNHKTDSLRADEDLAWCPECKCKWNIFEGRVWKSPDQKLWKEEVCPQC